MRSQKGRTHARTHAHTRTRTNPVEQGPRANGCTPGGPCRTSPMSLASDPHSAPCERTPYTQHTHGCHKLVCNPLSMSHDFIPTQSRLRSRCSSQGLFIT